ncbi:MAG TPA: response regulator transcription factor [Verrucomicrobiota bacterium]|nr:response regulator transcription factor [Verrucomicrobiota bacterium]
MKILIIEDDSRIGRFIQKGLQEVSYAAVWAQTLQEGVNLFYDDTYDAVVLDIGLPDGSGLDFLRDIQQHNEDTPVLVLSARNHIEDRINGLNLGADDYLGKPFGFSELLARLRALTRRRNATQQIALEYKGIRMDLLSRKVTAAGESMELSQREFAILEYLLQNKQRIVTRTQISEAVWEGSYDLETNIVSVYMSKLRQKLRQSDGVDVEIHSQRGVGYRLE